MDHTGEHPSGMDKSEPIGVSAVEALGVTLVLFHLLSAYKPNASDREPVRSPQEFINSFAATRHGGEAECR